MANLSFMRHRGRPAMPGGLGVRPSVDRRALATGLAVIAVAFALLPFAVSRGEAQSASVPSFLADAIGSSEPAGPLAWRPAPDVRVSVDDSGYRVESRGGEIGIAA